MSVATFTCLSKKCEKRNLKVCLFCDPSVLDKIFVIVYNNGLISFKI